jgi:hypothetical protein
MKYFIILLCSISTSAIAWDGYDYNSGASIEIDKNNLVRSGNDIEIYDYNAGEYRTVEIQDVNQYGNNVELEIYDPNNKMDVDEAIKQMEYEGLDTSDDWAIEEYIDDNSEYYRTIEMDNY